MTKERRESLPFVDGRPSKTFARLFEARHKGSIKLGKVSSQESRRFLCTNASNLTSYFAEIEIVIKKYKLTRKEWLTWMNRDSLLTRTG